MHCVNLLHSGLGRESPVLLLSVIKIKTVLSYLDHICNVFDPHTGPVQFFAFKKCELCKYFKKENNFACWLWGSPWGNSLSISPWPKLWLLCTPLPHPSLFSSPPPPPPLLRPLTVQPLFNSKWRESELSWASLEPASMKNPPAEKKFFEY